MDFDAGVTLSLTHIILRSLIELALHHALLLSHLLPFLGLKPVLRLKVSEFPLFNGLTRVGRVSIVKFLLLLLTSLLRLLLTISTTNLDL